LSVNATPVIDWLLLELAMVIVSVLVPLAAIVVGLNAFVTVGAFKVTVSVAEAPGEVVALVEVTLPVLLA